MTPEFLDRFSRRDSVCHRLPTALKIVVTFGCVLVAALIPVAAWPIHGCVFCLVFWAFTLAGIPSGYLLRRLLLLLPFLFGIAVSIPLASGFDRGWNEMISILMRGTVSFSATLWLVNVTPFDQFLATLSRWGAPRLGVAMLSLMYRYLFVLFREMERLRTARRIRMFQPVGTVREWVYLASDLGRLLIRSLSRAERVHQAMCSRGFTGHVRSLDS